jgi:myo-inositol-1(or 4)-monophosphatase
LSRALRHEALSEILRDAGAIVRRAAQQPIASVAKPDGSPVTAADRAVDDFLHRALQRLVPGSAWLSEETADDSARLAAESVWIVDPIDGTEQFLRGIPELAISIALVERGRPVAAAVANPMRDEDGIWIHGTAPVFRNLDAHAEPTSLDEAEAIVSRTESHEGDLRGLEGVARALRPVGSAAYKLLRVAAGADALTFSLRPKMEWDVCGGAALVLAAGQAYLRLDGEGLAFNQPEPRITAGAVAGPEALALELRRRIVASTR